MAGEVRLIRSPLSVAGMILTSGSVVLFLVVFLAELSGLHTNPYLGIVFFLLLPAVFLLGLALIPLGAWVERRRRAAGKPPAAREWPRIDFNNPTHRTAAVLVFALTMANIVIVSLAAYRGVAYMDSVEFCGQVCHTVMKPEFVAHAAAPHARVKCVACHVGSGPQSAAEAKLGGTRRLFAALTGTYARPIVATPEQLVASAETCEQCHSPEVFYGDRTRRLLSYADDETSTESVTTLRVHVGGGQPGSGTGAHWHADRANRVEYIATDDARQTIPYVRVTSRDGVVREYRTEEVSSEDFTARELRQMECTDCHNRPSHGTAATPERAVDAAMARGDLSRALPFIRREAVKALSATYPSEEVAARDISRALRDFYQQTAGGAGPDVAAAIRAVEDIYRLNVFPEMNVGFGTYPDNIGHTYVSGCFRCHDGAHASSDGSTIPQDCDACHLFE